MRVIRVFCVAFVLLNVVPIAQADDISGNWSGTYFYQTAECIPIWTAIGAAETVIAQNVNAFTGTVTLLDVRNPEVGDDPGPCSLQSVDTFPFTISNGVVSGSGFIAIAKFPGEQTSFAVNGSVRGNTMTLTIAFGPGSYARLTMTRTGMPAPNVIVSAFPQGMVQASGNDAVPATDSFSLTNSGDATSTVALAGDGSFFTLFTETVTLAAGETATIDIQALAQENAGVLEGSITASGDGVGIAPIRVVLLSATPPPSTARIAPPAARRETRGSANQNSTGAASFTNETSSTIQAIAVADVPWIIPQSGLITLPPGHATSVSYTIDRARRSDAAAPIGGGESGKLSLRFIGSSSTTASGSIRTLATTATNITTVSSTLVDIVLPGTGTSEFPPLGAGEVAYFFAGLGSLGNVVTDLMLSNPGTDTPDDLRFYFTSTSAGATTRLLDLTRLIGPHLAVSFPSMANNIFASDGQSGSLQIRGSSASAMSLAATRLASNVTGRYATAIPMLRSDAAAGAGGQVILSGVDKSAGVHTNLYIQEVSGHDGSVQIDFLGAQGQSISARAADAVKSFKTLELADAVPAGAVVARITTAAGGSARFAAYALVVDEATSDAWVVSDLVRSGIPPSGSFLIPVPFHGGSAQRNVFLTNVGASTITATIDRFSSGSRRRAVVHSESIATESEHTLAGLQTVSPTVSIVNGYLRLSAPAGTLNGGVRGFVAAPAAAALASGQSKPFTGLDDASASTIAAATPGTQRSSLILIETAGHSAVVRVTMRFTYPGGSKVTGIGEVTKEIAIAAHQMLTRADLGQFLIGPQRSSFGDLWNTQIDVAVLSGNGRVVAFIQSVDNGSGDVLMRID